MIKTTYSDKLHTIFSIMIPVFITQVTIMGMSFADTVMSGQASAVDLAGVAIGTSFWMPVSTGLNGILQALTPITAQLLGAGKKTSIRQAFWNSLYLAVFLSFLVIGTGLLFLDSALRQMTLAPEVHRIALQYLAAIAAGILPFFLGSVLHFLLDTTGYPKVTMKLFLLTLPLNVSLNYVFIFGKLGLPAYGGVGAGIATALTHLIILGLFIFVIRHLPLYQELQLDRFQLPTISGLKEQLRIGLPLGVSIFFETSIWAVMAFFMTKFGTETIAAHQAALNFSSMLYMFPLSFSISMTIIIGLEVGAKRYQNALDYAKTGITTNWCLALALILLLLSLREPIALMYGATGQVLVLTKQFLFYVAFFQLLDGTAAPLQGILRGYKDVKFAFWTAMIAYWCISLPLGWILDNVFRHGPYAYWQGIISGIFCTAVLLSYRLWQIKKRYS